MKKKALASSILVIAICLCLIAGSTFALFTDYDEFDVEVTAANVEIDAYITNLEHYSVTPDASGTVIDEFDQSYSYAGPFDQFTNTGKAYFDNNTLNIERITPGDKVRFIIQGNNTSNVTIAMRYTIEMETRGGLETGMVLSAAGMDYVGVTSYTSTWETVTVGNAMTPATVELGLPVYAGNEYETDSVKYTVRVEAVQGNAAGLDSYDAPIVDAIGALAVDAADVAEALANPSIDNVILFGDFSAGITIDGEVAPKNIDANGKAVPVTVAATAVLDDVTISNLNGDFAAAAVTLKSGAAGELTIKDSVINQAAGKEAILGGGHNDLVLNVDNCEFDGGKYAVRTTGNIKSVNIENTTFANKSGWAIMLNGTVHDTLSINNCEFYNCADGLAKAGVGGGGYAGVVTLEFNFTDNTVVNCFGHDGKETKMIEVKYFAGSTLNISGNTRDGAAWVPGTDAGIVQK